MIIIKVKTEKTFARKDAQLTALLQENLAKHSKRLGKLIVAIQKTRKQLHSSRGMSKASITKKMREIKKLDGQISREQEKGGRPRQYPKGVLLILEKKCPYCCKIREYDRSKYHLRTCKVFPGGIDYPEAYSEVVRINPGICGYCAIETALKSQRDTRPKGLWDTLFG
jgi:hypothetical protein